MVSRTDKNIQLLKCGQCGKLYFPPKYLCPDCGEHEFITVSHTGEGEVYTYTIIRMPFEEFKEQAPFAVAEIRLDQGLVVPGRFTNANDDNISIGSRVKFAVREEQVNWFTLI